MANTTQVTVGDKANIFYDQATGITVCKGEVVTLRDSQLKSKRVQQALNSGHLIKVIGKAKDVQKYSDEDVDKLQAKMKTFFEKGMEISKMATSFTLEEAKLLAQANEVSVDKNDTVETILKAILEE